MLFANNITFSHSDIYITTCNLIKDTKLFIFTSQYTETWIIRNIYKSNNSTIKYKNIYICPDIKKIIKKGVKHTKDNLSEKGISINNKSVDLIIIVYKNLNIINNKFSKVISFIDTFLRKFGKIIFIIDDKNEKKIIMANMQFVCDVSKVSRARFALELNNNNLLSYVKF